MKAIDNYSPKNARAMRKTALKIMEHSTSKENLKSSDTLENQQGIVIHVGNFLRILEVTMLRVNI